MRGFMQRCTDLFCTCPSTYINSTTIFLSVHVFSIIYTSYLCVPKFAWPDIGRPNSSLLHGSAHAIVPPAVGLEVTCNTKSVSTCINLNYSHLALPGTPGSSKYDGSEPVQHTHVAVGSHRRPCNYLN